MPRQEPHGYCLPDNAAPGGKRGADRGAALATKVARDPPAIFFFEFRLRDGKAVGIEESRNADGRDEYETPRRKKRSPLNGVSKAAMAEGRFVGKAEMKSDDVNVREH